MALGDVYQVRVQGRIEEQTTINVFHYRVTTAGSGDAEADLAAAFETNTATVWKNNVSADWTWVKLLTQKICPVLGLAVETTAVTGAGAKTGDFLPTFNAAIIAKLTAQGGRRFRGRTYIAGIVESQATKSNLSAGGLIDMGSIRDALDNVLTGNGGVQYSPCLFHPTLSGTCTQKSTLITSWPVRAALGTMRSRKVGIGI